MKLFSKVYKWVSSWSVLSSWRSRTSWSSEQDYMPSEASHHLPLCAVMCLPYNLMGWPPLGLTMLLAFPVLSQNWHRSNFHLDYSSWEEIVYLQSSIFITWLVFRKHWKTLTVSDGTQPDNLIGWTISSHLYGQNNYLLRLLALKLSLKTSPLMACALEAFEEWEGEIVLHNFTRKDKTLLFLLEQVK